MNWCRLIGHNWVITIAQTHKPLRVIGFRCKRCKRRILREGPREILGLNLLEFEWPSAWEKIE